MSIMLIINVYPLAHETLLCAFFHNFYLQPSCEIFKMGDSASPASLIGFMHLMKSELVTNGEVNDDVDVDDLIGSTRDPYDKLKPDADPVDANDDESDDGSDDASDARQCKAVDARLMALTERALSLQQSTSDRCTQLQKENQQLRQDNAKLVDLLQQQNQRATITRSTKVTRCKRRSTKAAKEPKPMGCYAVKAYSSKQSPQSVAPPP